MAISICGLDCSNCEWKNTCNGCTETNGKPFGGECIIAECCKKRGCSNCGKSFEAPCRLKDELIREYNALGIEDMEEVSDLFALKGSFVNLEYMLPSGQLIKFWGSDKLYLGNQICKKNSDRYYGLTADENYLLVCEYGENGSDPKIIVYKKRR